MAIGALNAPHSAGIAVPRNVSLVDFDGIELAAFTMSALTTIAQPKETIGTIAADPLLERLRTVRREPRRMILQAESRVRASSAASAVDRLGTES